MEINTQLKANLKSPEAANRETLQAAVTLWLFITDNAHNPSLAN